MRRPSVYLSVCRPHARTRGDGPLSMAQAVDELVERLPCVEATDAQGLCAVAFIAASVAFTSFTSIEISGRGVASGDKG